MNKFVSKQVEAASYTVAGKEMERQQIAQQVEKFEQRKKKKSKRKSG